MKNIIAIISTVIVVGLMAYTFSNGRAFQGGEAAKFFGDIKVDNNAQVNSQPAENENLEDDKIRALRDKAGNNSSFQVSNAYKSKCASCHGVDGSGLQNGKKLMGPGLIGQSEEKLYTDLVEFKAGRKENLIMKGLLINLSDEDLKEYAKEISQFKARRDALEK
ncbi:c-type cytochrome [Arcobacter sp. LA11]|uniref:c-type cytochrome n=1 Tax=Arcobacter sp. LA11 TaxID=1898176 RepID=UPI0009337C8C|nr:c-type cytochrome [Arcobacter sp. LA11]